MLGDYQNLYFNTTHNPFGTKSENVNVFYIRFHDIFWNIQFQKSQHSHLHKTQEFKKEKQLILIYWNVNANLKSY